MGNRQKITLLAGLTVLAMLFSGVLFFLNFGQSMKDPFSAHDREQALTPLYYPITLPYDYRIENGSVDHPEKGITTLTMRSNTHPTLYMSQQAVPNGFNMTTFYKNFEKPRKVVSTVGKIIIGTVKDGDRIQKLASITTKDKTWIIVNAEPKVDMDVLQTVATNLTKSR
ncbi:hypothetical protein TM7_0471 [candidate division TM7 genomosp. GTL1]|nr:hypothetical protein TM7_0471 [candidate division TM7 genomosp. GTL1]